MFDWWNNLSLATQIFYCVAIPSTLVLIIQTILTFLGVGDNSDVDTDGIGDIAEGDVDVGDGVYGDADIDEVHDSAGLDGLRIFTLRGIIAFFVVFGWMGVALDASGVSLYITLPIAFVCGLAMMFMLALIFRSVMKLRSDGNTDNRNAVGTAGKVQLTIPPSRSGEGKVHVMLQGSYVERNAVTDETEAIPTGVEIIVVGVSGQTDLVVKRK
jgi:membrane protein implicated in regulation of membrane protease activity